jgi:hypothetical protein
MATDSLTAADAILKEFYVGPVVEQLNKKTFMIDRIERDTTQIDFTGRRAIVPVEKARNRGRGSRADGGTLPAAGTDSEVDAIIPIRYHYQGVELTDALIEQTQSNQGAFINALDSRVKNAAKFMRKDINRQVFGDGTGLLATLSSTVTTVQTHVVDSIQYLHVGDPVDAVLITNGGAITGGASNQVGTLNASAKSVVLNTAIDGASGAAVGIYVAGNRNNEMDGLRNIAATTRTLHTINSATAGNEFWNGNVRTVGTQAGSEQVAGETSFELISDDVGQTGQGETEAFVTTRGVRRRLADTFQSQKRFTNREAVQIHGGYSAIMVSSGAGEVPVIIDDDCPKTWAFAIDNDALRWYQLAAPGYIGAPRGEGGGGIWHLKDGSTAGTKQAVWQAWMKWYAALGSHAPNRLGALKFCTDDNPTVTA